MKTGKSILTIGILLGTALLTYGQDLSPKEIIRKTDEKFNGEKTSTSIMAMTIVRPTWERTIEFKNWTSGRDYALTLIVGFQFHISCCLFRKDCPLSLAGEVIRVRAYSLPLVQFLNSMVRSHVGLTMVMAMMLVLVFSPLNFSSALRMISLGDRS